MSMIGTLQNTILKYGLDKVKIEEKENSFWLHNDIPVVCDLQKYWDNDDFNKYVHKIKVIDPNTGYSFGYYMSDLESNIRTGRAKIIITAAK